MNKYYILLSVIIFILIIIIVKLYDKVNQLNNIQLDKFIESNQSAVKQYKKELDEQLLQCKEEFDKHKIEYDERKKELLESEKLQRESYARAMSDQQAALAQIEYNITAAANSYQRELDLKKKRMDEDYQTWVDGYMQQVMEEQDRICEETDELWHELYQYQKKVQAINEEILRKRELEEKQDFYRITLDQLDIDDINSLNSIRQKLHKHENLDKLIYDTYISKPTIEMIKRVLKGEAPSGIYKITRLKTGEIYIGKSTDIKSRWQQHVKTTFGCGTISHSILHTTMQKDGIENFTFELLEEVPKEKLGEREKYWINFYNSKKYGMNEKDGG